MTLEITLVIVLALLNGFFALSEMALMTSRKIRLKQLATTSRRAKVAYQLSQTPEHLLATVQVFITLIGIGTAWGTPSSKNSIEASFYFGNAAEVRGTNGTAAPVNLSVQAVCLS